MKTSRWFALVVLSLFVAACGTDRRPPAGTIAEADFAQAIAAARCASAFRCCGSSATASVALRGPVASEAACTTSFAAGARREFSAESAGVVAGTVIYDADAAGRCVSDTRNATCGPSLYGDVFHLSSDCYLVYSGTRALGESCTDGSECDAPPRGQPDCSSGICASGYEAAALGAACDLGFTDCIDGYCDAGVCVAQRAAGSPCTDQGMCASLACAGGFCVPPLPVDSPCSFGPECASGWCSAGVCIVPICDGA